MNNSAFVLLHRQGGICHYYDTAEWCKRKRGSKWNIMLKFSVLGVF